MPTYVYRRPDGSTFECEQRITDEALAQDPETGEPVSRVLFPPAVVFKGHGFHNTDYGTRRRPVEAPASSRKGRGGKGAAHPRAGRGPAKAARRARASAR